MTQSALCSSVRAGEPLVRGRKRATRDVSAQRRACGVEGAVSVFVEDASDSSWVKLDSSPFRLSRWSRERRRCVNAAAEEPSLAVLPTRIDRSCEVGSAWIRCK